jgi:hypothetical protein
MLITLNVTKEIFNAWVKVAKETREADTYYDTPHGYRTMEGKYFPEIVGKIEGTYSPKDDVKCGWSFGTDFIQYATCGGNVWGMKEEGDKYIAYFSGRRSRIRDFIGMMKDSDPSFKKETANIVIHESAAPSDIHWWEEKPDYEARKDAEKEAAKKRAEENRRRSDRRFSKENNPFAVLKGVVKG